MTGTIYYHVTILSCHYIILLLERYVIFLLWYYFIFSYLVLPYFIITLSYHYIIILLHHCIIISLLCCLKLIIIDLHFFLQLFVFIIIVATVFFVLEVYTRWSVYTYQRPNFCGGRKIREVRISSHLPTLVYKTVASHPVLTFLIGKTFPSIGKSPHAPFCRLLLHTTPRWIFRMVSHHDNKSIPPPSKCRSDLEQVLKGGVELIFRFLFLPATHQRDLGSEARTVVDIPQVDFLLDCFLWRSSHGDLGRKSNLAEQQEANR